MLHTSFTSFYVCNDSWCCFFLLSAIICCTLACRSTCLLTPLYLVSTNLVAALPLLVRLDTRITLHIKRSLKHLLHLTLELLSKDCISINFEPRTSIYIFLLSLSCLNCSSIIISSRCLTIISSNTIALYEPNFF